MGRKKRPVDESSSERWLRKLLGEAVVLVTSYAKLSFGDTYIHTVAMTLQFWPNYPG